MRGSRATQALRRVILASFVAVAACGGATTPATQPAGTGPTQTAPGPVDPSPSPSAQTAPALTDADRAALADPSLSGLADYEARVEADLAERAGLSASVGPDVLAWLAGTRSDAIRGALEEAGLAAPEVVARGIAGRHLASAEGRTAADPGQGVIGAMLGASVFASGIVGGTLSGDERTSTRESTTERTIGNHRISATERVTVTTSSNGSTATADLTASQTFTIHDAATGAVVGTASYEAHVRVEVTACPDAAGIVRITVVADLRVDGSGTGGGSAVDSRVESETTAEVGDDAMVRSSTTNATTSAGVTPNGGPRRASSSVATTSIGGLLTQAGPVTVDDTGQVVDDGSALLRFSVVIATQAVLIAAQDAWRSGACVRIEATERSRGVLPREVVSFTAKPVHKVEGIDLDKPLDVSFSGVASLAPTGHLQPPPVSLTFTAGSNLGEVGAVTLMSTSNRGIGTLTIEFRVVIPSWVIDQASGGGRIMGERCGGVHGEWAVDGTYDVGGNRGTQRWVIDIDGDTMTGTFTYRSTQKGVFAGITVTTKGRSEGTARLALDDAGRAIMDLDETSHSFRSTTSVGGAGQDVGAPLQAYRLEWEVGGTC